MQQKFKWNKCSEILPNNHQDYIIVSYFVNAGNYNLRVVSTMIGFNPATNIVNGKLMYADTACDYWSALPNLPKNAELGVLNKEQALLLDPQIIQ